MPKSSFLGWVFLLMAFVGGVFLLAAPGSAAAADLTDREELEVFMDGLMAAQKEEFKFTGATLSIVEGGEVLLSKGYGYSDPEQRIPVDPERTLFRPGSTSKLITWTAVMQLVEQGKIDLEADVNQYLDFEIPAQNEGSGQDLQPITMTHLMTHTPGFEDRGAGLFLLEKEEMEALGEHLENNIPARVFPPGEVMAYSNYGTALAGYIVERLSGQPFAEYVEQHIFTPLGMENSTFRQPPEEVLNQELARAYGFAGGKFHEGSFEYIQAKPAGSMSSTASDMAKFMNAHLQEGAYGEARILEEETAREMHRQQFTHHPRLGGMTYGFIEAFYNDRRTINHGGDTLLFHSGLYLLPEEELGLFVSYSGGSNMFWGRERLFQAFMDRYYPAEPAPDFQQPGDAGEAAHQFLGEYLPNRRNFTTVEKLLGLMQAVRVGLTADGHLLVNFFGFPEQFVEVEPGVYTNRLTEGTRLLQTLVFETDEEGRTMLYSDGPMTYMKAPWYSTSLFNASLAGLSLLLLLGSTIGWVAGFGRRLLRKQKTHSPGVAIAARWTGIVYTLLALAFLVGLGSIVGQVDPAFGVPRIFFEDPPGMEILMILPLLMAITGVAVLLFAVLAWMKGFWRLGVCIHYTLFTASSLALLWVMYFWNLL